MLCSVTARPGSQRCSPLDTQDSCSTPAERASSDVSAQPALYHTVVHIRLIGVCGGSSAGRRTPVGWTGLRAQNAPCASRRTRWWLRYRTSRSVLPVRARPASRARSLRRVIGRDANPRVCGRRAACSAAGSQAILAVACRGCRHSTRSNLIGRATIPWLWRPALARPLRRRVGRSSELGRTPHVRCTARRAAAARAFRPRISPGLARLVRWSHVPVCSRHRALRPLDLCASAQLDRGDVFNLAALESASSTTVGSSDRRFARPSRVTRPAPRSSRRSSLRRPCWPSRRATSW